MRRFAAALLTLLLCATFSFAGYHDHGGDDAQQHDLCPVCASAKLDVAPAPDSAIRQPPSASCDPIAETGGNLPEDLIASDVPARAPPVSN